MQLLLSSFEPGLVSKMYRQILLKIMSILRAEGLLYVDLVPARLLNSFFARKNLPNFGENGPQ